MGDRLVCRMDFPGGRLFDVVIGNLLEQPTEAIVNAANGLLAHGGGIAAAIARAAGPALDDEGQHLVRETGPIPTGEAVVTTAGRLPFAGVIHAVGPRQGEGDEEARLASAIRASLERAHEREWTSVAFPAVSSGIFAVPLPVCARAYVLAVSSFFESRPDTSIQTVRLVLVEGPLVDLMRKALGPSP